MSTDVHTVEVPLDGAGDGVLRVQIREVDESLARVGRGGRSVTRASRTFGEMVDSVRPVADGFVGRLSGLVHPPDEITLEFGLSLSAEADIVIASTATQANFSVTLTWNSVPAAAPAQDGAEV
ncbi:MULTISPECIES: CU044_2847 family protein [unclassified Streptomyces]|uniref:CU044_2847 family protein n=1 Tax=unclassified Streptomyces TaxID=2593676 RepID=UPI002250F07F|nr:MULTISPECIES: CU044_2847 family protein [unclassified Streptomyces]MCX4529129.1 CU044_2847 family protein [Streptomyces sp. NBC_01551]MCX4540188.1 CU044_2847 family protein [Streptomyces sp. NBC_01565]